MEELHLVYQNKGILTASRILPRYIKGQKFSAKIVEENKSRSFAYSRMYGIFSDRESADRLITELRESEKTDPRTDKIEAELDKLRPELEKLESQQERLEERLEKKRATADRLYDKEELTDAQDEQLSKIEAAIEELEQKEAEVSDAHYALDERIDGLGEELYSIEEQLYEEKHQLWESKRLKCIEKIESLDIEVRPETPKAEMKPKVIALRPKLEQSPEISETNPFKSDPSKNSKVERHKRKVAAAISEGWVVTSVSNVGTQLKKGKTMSPVTVFYAILAGISVFFSIVAALFFVLLTACNHAFTKEKTKFIPHE